MEIWERELNSSYKQQSRVKSNDIEIIGMIFMLIGIFASVFFIVVSFAIGDYEIIDKADAIVYQGKYERYIHDTQDHADAYYIVLDDNTSLRVPIERQSLRETIKDIQKGQDITILAHPKSQIILSLCVDGEDIIDFDEAQKYMKEDFQSADGYFWIGSILLVSIVGYNLVAVILKILKKKK